MFIKKRDFELNVIVCTLMPCILTKHCAGLAFRNVNLENKTTVQADNSDGLRWVYFSEKTEGTELIGT